jgi:hypothetical protein
MTARREMMMLTILVGNVKPYVKADLCAEDLHLLPREIVVVFNFWVKEQKNQTLRVYNDTLINYIGELIEAGTFEHQDVRIITANGTHSYTEQGLLDSTWPYGIFNR